MTLERPAPLSVTPVTPSATPAIPRRSAWRLAALLATVLTLAAGVLTSGCGWFEDRPTVVVYTALDRGFSEPILAQFEKETGIRVRARYDTESTKTVGLVNALRGEAKRPRCDVFWNNEIVNTLRLKEEGLLVPFVPVAAEPFPAAFKCPDGYWTGFAARARVLLVNNDLVPAGQEPRTMAELTWEKWRGKVAIAKPLFGTTATHAACLDVLWGTEQAAAWFAALKANEVRVEGGNKQVALAVAAGRAAVGWTDTDDAIIEVAEGRPVRIVYPDGEVGQDGVLFIPNTLALVRGGPHPDYGRRLIEYLLRPEVEAALAAGPSAQIPLNPRVTGKVQVKTPLEVKAMEVDFAAAATAFERVAKALQEHFLQ